MNWRVTMWRRVLCFLAIGVSVGASLTACGARSPEPPRAQSPHSPGDVTASGERQVTRERRPQVATELMRRQPDLRTQPPMPLVGLMPVWLTPHRRDNGDLIGGQWLWISSRPGVGPGPLAAPTAPVLEPVVDTRAEANQPFETAGSGPYARTGRLTGRSAVSGPFPRAQQPATSSALPVPEQMQAQYRALRRSLGLPVREEGAP